MENRLLVDWFGFSIRVDDASKESASESLDIQYICDRLLHIPFGEFTILDARIKYYRACYVCNGISIKVPYENREGQQGYFVTMTGQGCRYYESRTHKESTPFGIWHRLFEDVRGQVTKGFAVNIPRLDIAVDDFTGKLDLDQVYLSVLRGEVCTRFQRRPVRIGMGMLYQDNVQLLSNCQHSMIGLTAEFGSRESRSFCRFYDKRAEQLQRHWNDAEKRKEVEGIPHWSRMEFEFKKETAITMVNAFIEHPNFAGFFAEYVNGMIRFVEHDDSNISRCSMKSWWTDFLGTTKRLSLSTGDYKPITKDRHLNYVHKKLYGAVYAAMNIEGVDQFLENICTAAAHKLSQKHKSLCAGVERLKELCSKDLWEALKPAVKPVERFEDLRARWNTLYPETPINAKIARYLTQEGFFSIDQYKGLILE